MVKKIPFVISLLAILGFISLPLFIKVKVECKSQYGDCPSEIGIMLNQYNGKNIYSAGTAIKNNLKKNLLVSDYSIQFKLPDLLAVNIILIKPAFAVVDRPSGRVGLVDTSGKVLSIAQESGLPKILTEENLQLGKNVNEKTLFALKLIGGVYEMYQVDHGEIQDGSLAVELPSRFTVTFPLEGDTQVLLGELRLVYSKVQGSPDLASYSQIDLRFKNPVLR